MPTITDSLDTALGDSDEWIWGIEAIAAEAKLFKRDEETGEIKPHVRKAAHLLTTGALAGRRVLGRDKDGNERKRGQWVSSPRLIRDSLLPKTT
jgi:hypothetical protein